MLGQQLVDVCLVVCKAGQQAGQLDAGGSPGRLGSSLTRLGLAVLGVCDVGGGVKGRRRDRTGQDRK